MSINITITDAGRAEVINAENTGTAPVTIAEMGIGTGQYTPSPTQTSLQAEIKRVSAVSGETVADDVIHVSARDDSSDTYDVYEIGFYLASGTLFAVYSQTGSPVLEKAAQSIALVAVDITLQALNAGSITFGSTDFTNPPASTTVQGVVELATDAEAQTGTDNQRAVTPAALSARTATSSRTGLVELATNAETQAGTDNQRAVTPAALSSRTATETRTGLVELATNAETQTGTDNQRAVTPAALSARTATESRTGLVEKATEAEALAGADGKFPDANLVLKSSGQFGIGAYKEFVSGEVGIKYPLIASNGTITESQYLLLTKVIPERKMLGRLFFGRSTGSSSTSGTIADINIAVNANGTITESSIVLFGNNDNYNPSLRVVNYNGYDYFAIEMLVQSGTFFLPTAALFDGVFIGDPSDFAFVLQSEVSNVNNVNLGKLLFGDNDVHHTANGATSTETQAGTNAEKWISPASLSSRTATTTRTGLVELATDAETQAGTDSQRAVTPAALSSRTATTTRTGLVELATNAETQAGTDSQRAVTPAALKSLNLSPDGGFVKPIRSIPLFVVSGGLVTSQEFHVAFSTGYVTYASGTGVSLPGTVAGRDYKIYALSNGTLQAVAWELPAPANSKWVGGFHTAASNGVVVSTSLWDLAWRPSCNPRGMVLSPDQRLWVDIYLMHVDYGIDGYSREGQTIASGFGSGEAKIPAIYGGNGTATYPMSWYNAIDLAVSAGKRLPTYAEFTGFAYGVVENQSQTTFPSVTTYAAGYRSACGAEQVTGVVSQLCSDINATDETGTPTDLNITYSRGQVYTHSINVCVAGGRHGVTTFSGSRASDWSYYPNQTFSHLGARAVCEHQII